MLESFEELNVVFKDARKTKNHNGLSLIYQSKHKSPPLLFSSLSVKFTGRINFLQFRTSQKQKGKNFQNEKKGLEIISGTSSSYYSYGAKDGEKIDYSNIEMFLRTLHPEVNDIFLVTLLLLNMACLLEIFVQKGGPLRRFFFFSWTFVISNSALFFLWLPLTKVLQLPESKPLIDFGLKSLQAAMFSNIAAMVRKDLLLLSHHFEVFCAGFLIYGIILTSIKFKISNGRSSWPNLQALWQEDLNEFQEFFHSLMLLATPSLSYYNLEEQLENLLVHLTRPGLWLLPIHSTDYIQHLTAWKFCKNINKNKDEMRSCKCEVNEHQSEASVIQSSSCIICLDELDCGDVVKLLPCKHFFHNQCIESWLLGGQSAKNRRCPVCRYPANVA